MTLGSGDEMDRRIRLLEAERLRPMPPAPPGKIRKQEPVDYARLVQAIVALLAEPVEATLRRDTK